MLAALVAGSALVLAMLVGAGSAFGAPGLRVRGTRLLDGRGAGHVVALRGVNRSGLEYACIGGWGFFDSPHPHRIDDPAMIAAIKSWDVDVVRVPLNEDCWLGVNAPGPTSGPAYRRIVARYVRALNAAHMYVVLDLHWAAPGSVTADKQLPMPDRDHSARFWRSVGSTFKRDHELLFDLYNEPFGVGWGCWLRGCRIPATGGTPAYRAAGMQSLVNAVRSAGARQPLLLGGIDYASDVSGWLAHEPHDPLHQLIAAQHNYGGLSPCDTACRGAIVATHRRAPLIFGELGETDCQHGYIDPMMRFADRQGIGYLGWTWDATDLGWSCTAGPSLIQSYDGTPTGFGIGFRDHLRTLGVAARP